jgi:hypothetical protein
VPLVVSGDPVGDHEVNGGRVETTQIAPTILKLLGLDPNALKAVRIEHTRALPLDDWSWHCGCPSPAQLSQTGRGRSPRQLSEPASSRSKSVSLISPTNEWCPSAGMSTEDS